MAGHLGAGELLLPHHRGHSGVELHLAVDGQLRSGGLGLVAGVLHLVHRVTLAGALGGIAQEGNLGVNAEGRGGLGALQRGLHQGVLVGIDLDGAVPHAQALVHAVLLPLENKAGAHVAVAGLGLNELKRRPDGVRGGVGGTAQQAVGLPHLDQHGAEVVALHQVLPAVLGGHLSLAQLHHLLHHGVHAGIGGRVHNAHAFNVKAALLRCGLDLGLHTHQDGGQETILLQAGGGLQNPGVRALGKNQGAGIGFQGFDQFCKHDRLPPNTRRFRLFLTKSTSLL